MRVFRSLGPVLLISALALAGCDTPEERAEAHYKSGLELLEAGDTERALVEFRNVFRLNGNHNAARQQYAAILRERGEIREAMGQYLLIVEQDPENAEAYRDLTELALRAQDFETASFNIVKAYELAPDDPMVRALKATIDFRKGEDREAAVVMAQGVLDETPDNIAAHMVIIAERVNSGEPEEALALIDAALETVPEDEGLHLSRLAVLETMGDTEGVGAQLQDMAKRFPENPGVQQALIQWYLQAGDTDGAENILREAAAADPDNPTLKLTVVQFLYELKGADAARTELESLVASETTPEPYQQALAELDYSEGNTEAAITALRGLLEGKEASDTTREMQTSLAGILYSTGALEETKTLTDTVLAGDQAHVAALKLRARMAIEEDRPEAAIQDMRTALGQAPRDPEIMTIMAAAHERDGSRELMGERLALAVEVSNQGAAESLRYATFLMNDDRAGPAEGVIVDALRRAPENPDLLNALGRIHLERGDWARASQVADLLRSLEDPQAGAMANAIEAATLQGQGRTEDTVTLLEGLADEGGGDSVMAELVRTHVAAGNSAEAREYLNGILADDPSSLAARALLAGVNVNDGNLDEAEAIYRELIAETPEIPRTYQILFRLLADQGRQEEAEEILDAGIEAASDNFQLVFTKAGVLETQGDIPGTIALYEDLYARNSGVLVVANNLASLLTGSGADAESLDRAFAIARRLRSSDVPYFQDTYGWILHLRADSTQALEFLRPAAEGLPDNALVQFHLGEAEYTMRNWDEAKAAFARAIEAEEAGSPLPDPETARARLAELEELTTKPPEPEAEAEAAE